MTTPDSSRTISLPADLGSYLDELTGGVAIVRTALQQMRDRDAGSAAPAEILIGGGECGMLVRQRDWSATSLGPIDSWPA
ncbi:MAG: hypothetical protein EOP67_70800, partial [Sphingomonas sp.]